MIGSTLGVAKANKSGNTVLATINGHDVTVQVARDLSVSTGDPIMVNRVGAQWVAFSRLATGAVSELPVNPVLPNPSPSIRSGTLVVAPVETRTYGPAGWREDTADLFQGEYGGQGPFTGAAFYGDLPTSLAGATVTGATLHVRRERGGQVAVLAPTLRLVTEDARPAGAPTLTSSATGPSLAPGQITQDFTITTSWAQGMVDGTAGGLAVNAASGTPYLRFAGRGAWSPAWTLTINWTRG